MATSRGFGPFTRRMEVRADEIVDGVNRVVRATALVIDQAVVFSTPVDKGVARSNWRVGIGAAPTGTIPAYSPGDELGVGETANAQAAIAQGSTVIGSRRPGQDIFIANNLPYIQPLNDGSSRQAPAGFVETAVQQAAVAVASSRVFRTV